MLGNKKKQTSHKIKMGFIVFFSCCNRMAQFSVSDPANGSRSVNGTLLKKSKQKKQPNKNKTEDVLS